MPALYSRVTGFRWTAHADIITTSLGTPGLSCFAGQKRSRRNQIQPFVSLLQGSRGPRGHDGPPGSPGARVRAAHLEDIRKSLNVLSKKAGDPGQDPVGLLH